MAEVLQCPDTHGGFGLPRRPIIFLAGGITGCPNWQKELIDLLYLKDATLINPRRDNFEWVPDSDEARKQIEWEHTYLNCSDFISFWFPKETVCPITLYELGRWVGRKNILVGIHPKYSRKFDIQEQLRLAHEEQEIVYSLEELARRITNWN